MRVEEIENVWIELADGCLLAARLWLPADAERDAVPAILEYLPYRKRDATAARDELTHPVLAAHGYACVRVDMRGNGESQGLMRDEYLALEQDDALAVIAWIAAQPWCDGNVGMMGISWGGFNALQVAARRPSALKAIITLCSTDDRYADDIHYKGGAMLLENLGWASTMLAYSSRPPDPLLAGEQWRAMWMERLQNMPLLIETWLAHQRRDAYWKHGSVCEDFSAIEAAVFAIGGWGDAYSNAVPRMLAGLRAPRKGLVGPWVHKYPHIAVPEPRVDFISEALRWWDRWLKGVPNGVDEDPLYQAYLMDAVRPATSYDARPGRWIAERDWPAGATQANTWHLGESGLSEARQPRGVRGVCSPQTVGLACGEYCAMWLGPDSPADQRTDDAGSLVYDSPALGETLEIFGAPVAHLTLSVDRPSAFIAVRLCDLWPDGASTRVSYAVLNLCHRDGHEAPSALVPGKRYRVRVQLDDIAYAFPAGHRVRLAISTTYWPLVWPAAAPVLLNVFAPGSMLDLPWRRAHDDGARALPPPPATAPLDQEQIRPASHARRVEHDLGSGRTLVSIDDDFGESRIRAHGLARGGCARERYEIVDGDPLSARADIAWTMTLGRDAWQVRTESRTVMRADTTHFIIEAALQAFEGETRVFERSWSRRITRDHL